MTIPFFNFNYYQINTHKTNQLSYDSYLLWNLFLAWVPLFLSILLKKILSKKLWSSWLAMFVSLAWLVFIPNSFYLISDFIHLQDAGQKSILFDTTLFSMIILTGLMIGFVSVDLIIVEIKKRYSHLITNLSVILIFLISSFGIYVGRDLRWNSWDIVINPGGLLLDVISRLSNFSNYLSMAIVILSYFFLLISLYLGIKNIFKPDLSS